MNKQSEKLIVYAMQIILNPNVLDKPDANLIKLSHKVQSLFYNSNTIEKSQKLI